MAEIEETVEINHPDAPVDMTNKTLNEFVAEHVTDHLKDPADKAEKANKSEKEGSDSTIELDPKEPLGEKEETVTEDKKDKKDEKEVDENENEKKEKDEKEKEAANDEKETVEEKKEEPLKEGQPVPYERFQEVNREKVELKQRFEQVQPVVENFNRIAKFCQDNNIVPEQFEKALRVQALLNTNPTEALKEILPIVESLQGFVGNKLPDDLQKEVDEDKLSLVRAKEIAQLRAHNTYRDRMAKQREEMAQTRAQEQAIAEVTKSAAEWERTKMSSDPDYRKKAREDSPDGLYEDVRDKFAALLNARDNQGNFLNPVHSSQQMVELQERAYKMVKEKWVNRMTPKKLATKKKLDANGSQTHAQDGTIEDAKTMKEAIALRLKGRGISV